MISFTCVSLNISKQTKQNKNSQIYKIRWCLQKGGSVGGWLKNWGNKPREKDYNRFTDFLPWKMSDKSKMHSYFFLKNVRQVKKYLCSNLFEITTFSFFTSLPYRKINNFDINKEKLKNNKNPIYYEDL